MTGLDRIWAGWRSEYVSSAAGEDDGDDGCVLCRVIEDGSSVVWRDEIAAVILNAYPYTSGHVMVLPVSHVGELEELDWEQAAEIWAALADTVRAIKEAYTPHGLNIGANIGRVAGAGVPGHFHLHVLPRWNGDTNFMTTVAEARVLPEALPVALEKLQKAWPS